MILCHLSWKPDGNMYGYIVKVFYYTIVLTDLQELKRLLDERIRERDVCALPS